MLRLLGAIIDLIVRLLPTPKEIRDKEARNRRDENKKRIGGIFSGRDGLPWWVR
jgi:hypothetical protein